jgi:argininosuccinate synthase
MPRIVIAYSGGPMATAAVAWLAEARRAEVVTVTLDLGQGRDLEPVRERALAAGAVRAHVLDARSSFASDVLLPVLQAGAIDGRGRPLAGALTSPMVARALVDIARIEAAPSVAHGCPPDDPEGGRLERAVRALAPDLDLLAPARDWGMSPAEAVAYTHGRGIPVARMPDHPYRTHTCLWGRTIAGGPLDDPWTEPSADVFALTAEAAACPETPAYLDIAFERGVPVAVNGITMALVEIIASLATIAGSHGVGRFDTVALGLPGAGPREICEAPAMVVLHQAHRELESLLLAADLERVKHGLSIHYGALVADGYWFSPLREALDAFVARAQEPLTGSVRLKLFKGSSLVVGRQEGAAAAPQEAA